MEKNMNKHKTINKFKLLSDIPNVSSKNITLPFNGNIVTEKSFSFSFACFDRKHYLFNLGDNTQDGVVSGKWFLDLMDCLKSASNMTITELKTSMHNLHPINWNQSNTKAPLESKQREYWQFRINKSKGRVIGFLIDGIFYVVWLDPHHNLTDSNGYGGIVKYKAGLSIYETQNLEMEHLKKKIYQLEEDLSVCMKLLDEVKMSP